MEAKFLPNLFRRRKAENSPVAHAIAGSAAATSGMYGSVFSTQYGGWDVQRAVLEGLERVIWVFRCVDAISSNQSKLPLIFRQDDPDEGRTINDPRLFRLLNRRCNIHETSQDFRYRLSSQLLLSKRGAFIEVVHDSLGRPKALELLPPHMVEPIPDPETFVSGYRLMNQVSLEEIVLPTKKVIWLKLKPHPIDPYLQLTPLTAAGLVVDTDWLARLFNRNFLLNDGRPGLLIAIAGHMNQVDTEEVKRRFAGGPNNAGRTTVVEADDINAQDLSASPRDSQWLEAIRGAKEDILMAFGVPESVLGNASGRTYDNADAEKEVFWEETMQPHCNAMARGLDPLTGDVDDDKFVSFDYDKVEVLQRRKRERHAKLKEELDAGNITLDEYYKGTGRRPMNVPGSRVIFMPNGVIVGESDEDVQAAAQLPIVGLPSMEGGGMGFGGGGQVSEYARQGAIQGARQGQRSFENIIAARAMQLSQIAAQQKALPRYPYSVEHKVYDVEDADTSEGDLQPDPFAAHRERIEAEFVSILGSWDDAQDRYIPERLDHVKSRKHTRHWEGAGTGTKALDPQYAVDITRWAVSIRDSMRSMMRRVVTEAARTAAREMVATGIANAMNARGQGSVKARSALGRVFGSTQEAEKALNDVLRPMEDLVTKAAKRQSARIMDRIREMDTEGASMTAIKREVRDMIGTRSSWREGLARYLTTALTEGGKKAAYDQAGNLTIKKWNTREDEKVRPTHRAVDGRETGTDKKFRVGKYWMDRPGDPRGGIEETINCRCWLTYDINPAMSEFYDVHAG